MVILKVVNSLKDLGQAKHMSGVIQAISRMLDHDWEVRLMHTYREGNQVADVVRRLAGTRVGELLIFTLPPDGIPQKLLGELVNC
ncbi:hypothetical protein PVK06_018953 [Gossypium arboreum]|uniref:RNase H type-1 domain-containing protein n=1 Tax=Gossypium arboreum TaxID=29729 RepID=A0ABR0PIF6_GOSAR|nr:hypothetical protein PVK06_018953 [Gossypium arboreum]